MSAALVVVALVVALLAVVGAWLGGVAVGRRQEMLKTAIDRAEVVEMSRINRVVRESAEAARFARDAIAEQAAAALEVTIAKTREQMALHEALAKAWTSFVAGLALVPAHDDDDLRTPEGDRPSPSFRDGWDAALVQVRTLVDSASAGGRPEVLESVLGHLQWTRALLRGTRMEACLRNDAAEGAKLDEVDEVDALLGSFGK